MLGISDAAEADNATHLLVLLVAGGAEHLIEVLLVESAAVLPIEPFDHERRESGEVVDRRRAETHPAERRWLRASLGRTRRRGFDCR